VTRTSHEASFVAASAIDRNAAFITGASAARSLSGQDEKPDDQTPKGTPGRETHLPATPEVIDKCRGAT
jgi:hypothetical protein